MGLRNAALSAAFATVLCTAFPADALTLGRARGPVLIGRPLNITVPLTLESGEAEPCLNAELFQGDTRSGALEATLEAADNGHAIRLRSAAIVEEPVITVYVRVGCAQPFTRSYVLLAEQVQEIASAPIALAPSPMLSIVPRTEAPAAAPAPAPSPAAQRATTPRAQRRTAAAPKDPTAAAKPKPRAAQRPTAAQFEGDREPPRRRGPRLMLEAIDAAVEQAAPLKLTTQMAPPQPATPAQRAEAAAAWKTINKMPEEAAQAKRPDAVEAEVKALREAVQRQTAGMNQLAEQLESVRSQRDFVTIILGTLATFVVLGGTLLLWLRSRDSSRQQDRWHQMASVMPSGATDSRMRAMAPTARAPIVSEIQDVDSGWEGLSQMPESAQAEPEPEVRRPKPAASSPMSEFAESQVGQSRLPKPQELLDIQQKVEFFVAIGQAERAIELLEAQIHDYLGSSPLVWLDLLDICHGAGKREQYERIREEFQNEFNARLPAFDATREDSAGLEDHPRALSRIELLWGSPRVLKVIEESLFEDPHSPGSIPFDLHASRDLLLLYSIARETVQQQADGPPPEDDYVDYIKTALAEMPPAGTPAGEMAPTTEPVPLATLDEDEEALPQVLLGPDIDLSFPDAPAPAIEPDGPAAGESAAKPEAPPAPVEEFDFDFEPRARGAGRL